MNDVRLAGVIGDPVGHSLSPALHGHWFARAGRPGVYKALAVKAADLERAVRALPLLGYRGANVTVPHKVAAAALVDDCDAAAATMGAVNTILARPDGGLFGMNTDGHGFLAHLRASAPSWRPQAGPVVLLGAGGAARAIAFASLDHGVGALRVVNRDPERAQRLEDELRAHAPDAAIVCVAWKERAAALAGAALLVNATSLGMTGAPPLEIALDALPRAAVVYDIVYVPLETPLLAAARARGHGVVDGLGMLLHQATPGFAWWGGVEPVVDDAARAAVLAALRARDK